MGKIAYTVEAINARLEAKGSKVRVVVRGKSALNLRATLPPRPLSSRPLPHQQHIPLNLAVSPEGLKRAEYEADKLHGALVFNTFSWDNYVVAKTCDGTPTAELIALFKTHYFANNHLQERTWTNNWHKYLRRLPQNEPLTVKAMEREILATPETLWSRRVICATYRELAKFAKLPADFSRFVPKRDRPRSKGVQKEIPSDDVLFAARERCNCATITSDAGWRWIYSIMLLAGIRPHEAFFCEWSDAGLEVLQGKTGPRTIFYEIFELMHPGLIEAWNLKDIRLPDIDAQGAFEKGSLGSKVNIRWKRWGLEFPPYDLRHAWAIRASVKFGIRTATAAALMGHSEEVHVRVYHRWLSAEHNRSVLQAALDAQKKTL